MVWTNNDGLVVKYGLEESVVARGGDLPADTDHVIEFDLKFTDVGATAAVITGSEGGFGVVVPKNAFIKKVEIFTTSAFTSSGTIGSATLVLGLNKAASRAEALDADAFTTTAFVGSNIDAAGELVEVKIGATGAGSAIGTALAENGVVTVYNSANASHPLTAGAAKVRIYHTFLTNV